MRQNKRDNCVIKSRSLGNDAMVILQDPMGWVGDLRQA